MGIATQIHDSICNIVSKVNAAVHREPLRVRGFSYVILDLVVYPDGFSVDTSRAEWRVTSGGIYSFDLTFRFVELADMLFPEDDDDDDGS
jgi:hypothetical protein